MRRRRRRCATYHRERRAAQGRTVGTVLTRHGLPRLAWLDRPTGQPVRRYERARPGELVHVDVKKLGRLRDGGGWRIHGRESSQERRTKSERNAGRRVGYEYVHCAIDDQTRLAYAEIHPDERAETCAGFLRRAAAWFADHGIRRIERVMTDNALTYRRGVAWRQAVADLGAHSCFTPQIPAPANGKAKRFNRTLLEGWAYAQPFTSSADRAQALPGRLHTYNHHRTHTAIGGQPPSSRILVNDLEG